MNDQDEQILKAQVIQALGQTQLEQHLNTTSTASGAGVSATQRPLQLADLAETQRTASNFARANNPPTTNPAISPNARFNPSDGDESEYSVKSGYSAHTPGDGGLGADVADALDHHKQAEESKLTDISRQVRSHLYSVASRGLPLAHDRAQRQQ